VKFRGKKGEIFEFFLGHISSVHSSFGLVAVIYIYNYDFKKKILNMCIVAYVSVIEGYLLTCVFF
jgi:hypothetical protein